MDPAHRRAATMTASSPGPDLDRARTDATWRPAAGWRELLVGRSPEEVLERILADDPLRLRALAARTIRASCRFVDADRVVLRAFARVAHGVTVAGPPAARRWIEDEVAASVEDLLAAERASVVASTREPADEGSGPASAFAVLGRPLGVDGDALRRACDAFNRRPAPEREAYFALVVDRVGLDEAAQRSGVSATEVARRARRALEAILEAAARKAEVRR
jgi:DNA-directed RNA polymerase specialized sigma24 family protein